MGDRFDEDEVAAFGVIGSAVSTLRTKDGGVIDRVLVAGAKVEVWRSSDRPGMDFVVFIELPNGRELAAYMSREDSIDAAEDAA